MTDTVLNTPTVSPTAHLVIPPVKPPATIKPSVGVEVGSSAWFTGLQRMIFACGPKANKHEKVNNLIAACISDGVDTGRRIIGVVSQLGFNPKHVGKLLQLGTGNDQHAHLWCRSADGRYHLIS